jgi:nitrile hydratase subunit beta
MNGPADLGGMMGFGLVQPDPGEPLFHAGWERRVLGLTLAVGTTGSWTIDQSRHARETLPHAFYWSSSYYQIWLAGLLKLLTVRDMVIESEITSGKMQMPPRPVARVLRKEKVAEVLAKGSAYDRAVSSSPLYSAGTEVKTRNIVTAGHTRLPSYAKMKRGVITQVHGAHVYPDRSGMGQGEDPQWLYSVKFSAHELFGSQSQDSVYLDLWEPYLDIAP